MVLDVYTTPLLDIRYRNHPSLRRDTWIFILIITVLGHKRNHLTTWTRCWLSSRSYCSLSRKSQCGTTAYRCTYLWESFVTAVSFYDSIIQISKRCSEVWASDCFKI